MIYAITKIKELKCAEKNNTQLAGIHTKRDQQFHQTDVGNYDSNCNMNLKIKPTAEEHNNKIWNEKLYKSIISRKINGRITKIRFNNIRQLNGQLSVGLAL